MILISLKGSLVIPLYVTEEEYMCKGYNLLPLTINYQLKKSNDSYFYEKVIITCEG